MVDGLAAVESNRQFSLANEDASSIANAIDAIESNRQFSLMNENAGFSASTMLMDTEVEELEEDLSSGGLSIDDKNNIVDDKSKEGRPYVGMEFNSEEDAREYYNRYAKLQGFGTSKGPYYRSIKKAMVTTRSFCCSYGRNSKVSNECNSEETSKDDQGNSFSTPKKNVAIIKTNCKAHIREKLEKNGKWKVTAFKEEHSHPCISPEKVKFYRSHRQIPKEVKDMIITLRNENAPIK